MRQSIASRRADQSGTHHALRGMLRRAALALAGSLTEWQLSAHDDETFDDVPVYTTAGFAAWPAAGETVRAIVAALGGSARDHVIIATSSVDGQPDMTAGETAMWNSLGKGVKATATGELLLGNATAAVEPVIRGSAYRAAEDTLLAVMASAFAALGVEPAVLPATRTAALAVANAMSAFALASPTYLSTVTKTE